MHKSSLGVRPQYLHNHLDPSVLSWFRSIYPSSGFHGRFQLGHRKTGERGIWPLFTGELEPMAEFLETMHVSQHLDYYITANSFSGTQRVSNQLFSLHHIVIDIDAHDVTSDWERIEKLKSRLGRNPSSLQPPPPHNAPNRDIIENLIYRLDRDLFSLPSPPPPSSIICTGRGLQLWWSIVPMSYKCLPWYQEIRDTIMAAIEEFLGEYPDFEQFKVDGAASRNPVGYYRLPGTVNTHTGTVVKIECCNDLLYDTHDLIKWAKNWSAEHVKENYQPLAATDFSGKYLDSDIYIFKNFHTSAFFRVRQLIQLRLLRDNEIGEETRNNMCFIAYNAMLPALGPEIAWDKLLKFNEGFKKPMSEKELHQTIDTSLKKGGYRYKNKSIITFLDITPEEQEAIGLYPPTEPFSPYTRLSGHPSEKAARQTVKQDRNAKILAMSEAGMTRSKIAEELGIARNTVGAVLGSSRGSKRQEALDLLKAGHTTREVADKLGISIRSVQLYQKNEGAKNAQKTSYI